MMGFVSTYVGPDTSNSERPQRTLSRKNSENWLAPALRHDGMVTPHGEFLQHNTNSE